MNIIIAVVKSWNIKNAIKIKNEMNGLCDVYCIDNKDDLNYHNLKKLNPKYIFFPHWSWIIPKEIYENFNCVVFHTADLPYGRGGSPIQNLISLGIKHTKISAIKVDGGIDTGDIYLKEDVDLYGNVEEILVRISHVIFKKMIPHIIKSDIVPHKQEGEILEFKRRTAEQSELQEYFSLEKIYDYIRMLDGEGYPSAFIKFGKYRLEFSRASLKSGNIIADVKIIDEGDNNAESVGNCSTSR